MSEPEQPEGDVVESTAGAREPGGAGEATGSQAAAPPRQLVRARDDRVIAGVCGGLGRYLGVDPVLVRIAALLLVFAGGAGIVLYVVGWVAMPEEPDVLEPATAGRTALEAPERTSGALVLGLVFVALGVFFLIDAVWADFLSWRYVWPIALIAVGAAILLRPRR